MNRGEVSAYLVEVHAREKLGMPEEWTWYTLSSFPPGGDELICFIVKGAVASLLTKGPNAGKLRNWKKRDLTTDKTVYIQPEEHRSWLAGWEERTGHCYQCSGKGQVLKSWSLAEGAVYRDCPRCGGSGKRPVATPKNQAADQLRPEAPGGQEG